MKKTAVYPGTFDPITYGHLDIIKRAGKMFDNVIIAVSSGEWKRPLFSWEERLEMVKTATKGMDFITVEAYDGLLVDYMAAKKARIVIRGLRAVSDFEYEFQLALVNKNMNADVEMIFLMPEQNFLYISSSVVKQIAYYDGDVSKLVPVNVAAKLRIKYLPKPLKLAAKRRKQDTQKGKK